MDTEQTINTDQIIETPHPHVVDKALVDKTIRNSVYIALGVGIVPLPLVDIAALTAASLDLTRRLSGLYGVDFKEGMAKKIITSLLGAVAPSLASPSIASFLIGVPLIGLPLAVGTRPVVNAGCIYAVGRMFVTHFERGGNFVSANIDELKEDFTTSFQNSREWLGDVIGGKKTAVESR